MNNYFRGLTTWSEKKLERYQQSEVWKLNIHSGTKYQRSNISEINHEKINVHIVIKTLEVRLLLDHELFFLLVCCILYNNNNRHGLYSLSRATVLWVVVPRAVWDDPKIRWPIARRTCFDRTSRMIGSTNVAKSQTINFCESLLLKLCSNV